jgi:hypothetical protein
MALSLRRPAAYALALALLASSISCGSTSPSAPITDNDKGSLTPGNFSLQVFSTSTGGNITVTLVSLDQPVTVEVQLGAFANNACGVQASDTTFTAGTQSTFSVSSAGVYCILLDDSPTPNPPASVAYTLTVQHPS